MRPSNMPVVIYAIMWATLWGWVYGQSVTTPTSARSAAVSAAASASATANATLRFDPVPTLTTCQTHRLTWTYAGPSIAGYNMSITALGNTGDQSNATTGEATAVTDEIANVAADGSGLDYLVKLRYGRYYLHARIYKSPAVGANSQLFWVQEGNDLSCLTESGSGASSSAPSASASASAASASASPSTSAAGAAAGSDTSSSGIGAGAIAGIVIGALAGIAAIILILFLCRRRKQREQSKRLPEISHLGGGLVTAPQQRSSRHYALQSIGGSADSHDKDEAAMYASDPNTPTYLAQYSPTASNRNPFASNPTTPQAHGEAVFALDESAAAAAASGARRQSQPPISPTDPSQPRSRSNSQPSAGPSGKVGGVIKRQASARRKPVPSLGAELKTQLAKERGGDAGERTEHLRSSFSIMPDPPRPINE